MLAERESKQDRSGTIAHMMGEQSPGDASSIREVARGERSPLTRFE